MVWNPTAAAYNQRIMKLPEIIGIAGTNGAGKDTLADLRYERQGIKKASLSDILRTEADKRGLSHDRKNLSEISTEWGRALGAAALSTMTIRAYRERQAAGETPAGISIVSIRRPAEAAYIQEEKGAVLWVDAPRELRYERIAGANRGRVDDVVTYEQFSEQEDAEMHPADTEDPFVLHMARVREIADIHLQNAYATEAEYKSFLTDKFDL